MERVTSLHVCLSFVPMYISLVLGAMVYIMRSLGTAIVAEAFTNKAPFHCVQLSTV